MKERNGVRDFHKEERREGGRDMEARIAQLALSTPPTGP